MKLHRSTAEPVRLNATWAERWSGGDQGFIAAWEQGREMSLADPMVSATARAGRLVPLPWKGGVDKPLKGKKYGTLKYIAMWQGLRGEDLDIDTEIEFALKCSTTETTVLFTNDPEKFTEP